MIVILAIARGKAVRMHVRANTLQFVLVGRPLILRKVFRDDLTDNAIPLAVVHEIKVFHALPFTGIVG
jgi:hypothetical protein